MRPNANALAAALLEARTLEEKLRPWPAVALDGPPLSVPPLRRPPGLELPRSHRKLPSVWRVDLQREHGRSRVLHELMNHELQAIELLALALLRFHDAPAGFRRALVRTLRDEQRHAALYLERLESCGGEAGQQPVSGFFWETLRGAPDPPSFVAALSLTLEAANLDYCRVWRSRFARAGDRATAAVIDGVYEDEIRHVKTGLIWFDRWLPPGADRLRQWERLLEPPLSPARARGRGFDVEGRRRAGFTDDEIRRLRVMGGSRGRPSAVYRFDAAVEARVARRPIPSLAFEITSDLATLPMFIAQAEDLVVAPLPHPAFLERLADAGIPIPRFVPDTSPASLGPFPTRGLVPWGIVPDRTERSLSTPPWNDAFAALSSKVASARRAQAMWARDPRGLVRNPGVVVETPPQGMDGPWVLKAPFSASGQGRIFGEGPLSDRQLRWARRALDRDGALLFQPYYTRVLDLSVQMDIGEEVRILGICQCFTHERGGYRGALLGRWTRGLAPPLLRILHDRSQGPSLRDRLDEAAREAGRWAQEIGYRGPLGLDATVVREGGTYRIHPWLETNARYTLGRIALALARYPAPGTVARWHVAPRTPERVEHLLTAPPLRCSPRGWEEGLLPTTDPARATRLLTWVTVAPTAGTPRGDQR